MKRRTLCIVLAFVMALGLMGCSSGDTSSDSSTDGEQAAVEYPTRDLSMIVPFGAGGATDLICRTLAAEMEKQLGVSIAVTMTVIRFWAIPPTLPPSRSWASLI